MTLNSPLNSIRQFYNCLLRIFRCIGFYNQFNIPEHVSHPSMNLFPSAPGTELCSFTIIVGIPVASQLNPSSLCPISFSFFILVEIISHWGS